MKIGDASYTPLAALKSLLFGDVGWGEEFVKGNILLKDESKLSDFLKENRGHKGWLPYFKAKNYGSDVHYNLPAKFFERLLGESMSYTCANFYGTEGFTLEEGQNEKHQWHANRLDIFKDASLFECGCGWGGFWRHLNRKDYDFKYLGLTISAEQKVHCYGSAGWGGPINTESWQDHDNANNNFDRFVSIGMIEHVGLNNLADYFSFVRGTLNRNGKGTLQFISRDKPISPWADKYIFPGAEPPNYNEVARLMRQNNLVITGTREGGSDYVLTLKLWLKNLEDNESWIISEYGLDFYRKFFLYLHGGICSFESGDSQLIQLAFEVQG